MGLNAESYLGALHLADLLNQALLFPFALQW